MPDYWVSVHVSVRITAPSDIEAESKVTTPRILDAVNRGQWTVMDETEEAEKLVGSALLSTQ